MFVKKSQPEFSQYTDQELVAKILTEKNKNLYRQMQGDLYDRYVDKVYSKCLSLVKNSTVAKDLSHDIMVKIFLKLQDFKGSSPFFGWVYAITYNHCMNYLQREKKWQTDALKPDQLNLKTDALESEHQELKELQLTQLEQFLDTLEESERLMLFMRYQNKMAIKAIAEALKLNESAVKMRLKRSRDRLAELFKKLEHEA
jgi:RNA polymerase sigma-70 factor (ECF subfamily)